MPTVKPMTPLQPLMQASMKPPSPLQPKNARKTPISHPQRRWRFQLTPLTGSQRRCRFQLGLGLREQRRQGFHARDFRCARAMAGPGRASRRRAEPHISDQAPPVWRVPEGPEGTGGLRDRPLRAVGSRVAISRAAGPDGARNTSGATSNKLNREFRLSHRCERRKRAWLQRPWAVAGPGCSARGWRRGLAGVEPTRRATHQRPGAAGVKGAGGTGERKRARLRRPWAVAGPGRASSRRAERSSRRGRRAGGPPPTGAPSSPARRVRPDGTRNTSGATSTVQKVRTPRSTPGSGRPGGRRGGQAH